MLRRILRRAVRHAFLLGADKLVMPGLVEESIAVMGEAYPDVVKNRDFITGVITREEERFRQTLRTGLTILEDELASGATVLPGRGGVQAARHLRLPAGGDHRDHRPSGASRSTSTASTSRWPSSGGGPRRRARSAAPTTTSGSIATASWSSSSARPSSSATATGRGRGAGPGRGAGRRPPTARATVEIFTDRTPFYAESGGQVGDTGTITTETGRADVVDTTYALPGPAPPRGSHHRRRDHRRPDRRSPPSTPSGARPSAATTPAPTSSTGRCARCWATT